MKTTKIVIVLIIANLLSAKIFCQDYHVRFAFLGNSITIGTGLANAPKECYPSQVNEMLKTIYGDTCIVQNFAVSGRTMLRNGDFPLWNEPDFPASLDFAPDIVYMLMGTNDSKPYNWDVYGDEFFGDYQAMIDTFKVRNPRCQFIVSYPPPAYAVVYDIRDSVILNGVIPVVDSILATNEAYLVDYYHPLLDSVSLFPDKIHPNAAGAKVMAKMVFDKIVETNMIHKVDKGYTYVTGLKTSNKLLAVNNEVTLSWTSRNADSVYFDKTRVELSGSIKLIPAKTTTYKVTAYGSKSIDVKQLTQEVYTPELVKMKTTPASKKIMVGDSVKISLTFTDQNKKEIKGAAFNVNWTISEGKGSLIDKTSVSAVFVATEAGSIKVLASVGTINAESRFTVETKTSIEKPFDINNIRVYPNPAKNEIHLSGNIVNGLEYKLLNISGQTVIMGNVEGKTINISGIERGVYYLQIVVNQEQRNIRFTIE